MRDRRDAVAHEKLGEQPHHHLAVLEHVRDAAGHAQVVLEHVELAGACAHDVDAGDVRVDVARHVDTVHLGPVLRVAEDLVGRNAARAHDLLVVVDVVDVAVQRAHALAQAGLELAPFGRRDDARDDIERNQPLGAAALFVLLAVDRKGDADAAEDEVGLRALVAHRVGALLGQPALEFAVVLAHLRLLGAVHLVKRHAHPRPEWFSFWSGAHRRSADPV